jgi:putative membrane protein
MKISFATLFVTALLTLPRAVHADFGGDFSGHMHHTITRLNENTMLDLYGFHGLTGGLMMLFFWALIIIGIISAMRFFVSQSHNSSDSNALDILKERYAKGEIDKDEFESKKKDIR